MPDDVIRRLRRWRRRLWWATACVGVAALGLLAYHRAQTAASTATPAGSLLTPGSQAGTPLDGTPAPGFSLVDQFGQRVSLSQYRGRAVILTFVDSRCTTICPLTAATLHEAQNLLGPLASRVQLVAVNVNAAATSVADVRQWSADHGMLHRWVFVTGSHDQLAAVWRAYHVYVQVVDGALMHDPAVYVIGPDGRQRQLFLTQPSPLLPDIAAQGRAIATAAATALGAHVALQPSGAVPAPVFATYGPSSGAGTFASPAFATPTGLPEKVFVGQGRPALVDFYSSTCLACAHELPTIAAYAQAARKSGLPGAVMVDVAFGGFGAGQGVAARPPYPVVVDKTGGLTDAYGVTALPYLALTSPDGTILWRHAGLISLGDLERAIRTAERSG